MGFFDYCGGFCLRNCLYGFGSWCFYYLVFCIVLVFYGWNNKWGLLFGICLIYVFFLLIGMCFALFWLVLCLHLRGGCCVGHY